MKIYNDIENPYMPKRCMFNIPYGVDYSAADIHNAREAGKKEAQREYEEKLNELNRKLVMSDTVNITQCENSLVGDISKYCDIRTNTNDAPKNWNLQFDTVALLGDIPKQNNLPHGSKLCGYVEIDGTYHKCASCEHEKNIRQIIWNNDEFRKMYFDTKASFFDRMPRGMLQEEFFAMKVLGFVKISSFANTPNQMIVFWYNSLTYKQTDLIYPR